MRLPGPVRRASVYPRQPGSESTLASGPVAAKLKRASTACGARTLARRAVDRPRVHLIGEIQAASAARASAQAGRGRAHRRSVFRQSFQWLRADWPGMALLAARCVPPPRGAGTGRPRARHRLAWMFDAAAWAMPRCLCGPAPSVSLQITNQRKSQVHVFGAFRAGRRDAGSPGVLWRYLVRARHPARRVNKPAMATGHHRPANRAPAPRACPPTASTHPNAQTELVGRPAPLHRRLALSRNPDG